MRSGGASELRIALQLEKINVISTHVIMFFYMYCVRCWNVLIYKAVNTWK